MGKKISVIHIDPDRGSIELVKNLLEGHPLFDYQQAYTNAQMGFDFAMHRQPDVLLTEAKLPYINVCERIAGFSQQRPDTHIVIYTQLADEQLCFKALYAGVWGYLLKGNNDELVLLALQCAAENKMLLSPEIGSCLRLAEPQTISTAPALLDKLTDREREVMELFHKLGKIKAMGEELGLSKETMKSHSTNIRRKFGVKTLRDAEQMVYNSRN